MLKNTKINVDGALVVLVVVNHLKDALSEMGGTPWIEVSAPALSLN